MTPAGVTTEALAPDTYGRAVTQVSHQGRVLGRVSHLAWDEAVAIYGAELDDGRPADEALLVAAILGGLETLPKHLTHAMVRQPETLTWYRGTPYGAGTVVSGTLRGRVLYYDALARLEDGDFAALGEDDQAVVTVVADRTLDHAVDPQALTEERVLERMRHPSWIARVVFLRTMGRVARVPRPLTRLAHQLGLFDAHHGVRQFAAVQLCDFFGAEAYTPAFSFLAQMVRDPEVGLPASFDWPQPPGVDAFDVTLGRRNARFAAIWVIGNRARMARGYPGRHDAEAWLTALDAICAVEAPLGWDETWLANAARQELLGEAHPGVGSTREIGVLEMVRFLVLRHQLVVAMDQLEHDKFYWLTQATDDVYPSPLAPVHGGTEHDDAIAQRLYGKSSAFDGVDPVALPAGLSGPNPLADHWNPRDAIDAGLT